MALKHVSLCLVLFVSAQVCLAGPTTTPAPTTFFTLFGDLLESAQKTVVEAGKNIQQILGMPEIKDVNQVVATLQNASLEFSKTISDAIAKAKDQVDPNAKALAETVQKFYTEVNKTTEELRKKIPELNATELQKAWTKSLKNLVDQASKLRETLEKETPEAQENLSKTVLGLLETVTKAANSFADKVHETVSHNEHPDHAKHHKN